MILNRRVFRELINNPIKYLALFFIVTLAVAVVVGMAASTDSINKTVTNYQELGNLEAGEFSVYTPLNSAQIEEIESKGFLIEPHYYIDVPVLDGELRVFSNRSEINKIAIVEGRELQSDYDVILEQKYASANNYKINDYIYIAGEKYQICAVGCVPDYIYTLENTTDLGTDNTQFGLVFVTENTFDNITDKVDERVNYQYAYCIASAEAKSSDLKDYLMDLTCDESLITDTYLRNLYTDINELKDERDNSIKELLDGSEELTAGLEQMESGTSELTESIEETRTTVSNLGVSNIASVLELQKAGGDTLVQSAGELKTGSVELKEGIEKLSNSYIEITEDLFEIRPTNLSSFLERDNNKRINAAQDDAVINKMAALYSGIIVFVLIAFMFSVFAIHNVDVNKEIVGTLYAMGYRRKEIVKHFIILPVTVVFIGSVIGLVLGFLLAYLFAQGNSELYSYPPLEISKEGYLCVYGLLMPNILTMLISYFVLTKKLNCRPLELLRNEKKVKETFQVSLNNFKYVTRYQVRQTLRECRTTIIMFLGMGISILLMVWGFSIYGGLSEYAEKIEKDVPHEYLYLLSNPLEEMPQKCESAYMISAETQFALIDDKMEVSIMGVAEDSDYYSFANLLPKDNQYAIISNAVAKKFGYKVGDTIVLSNTLLEKNYCITVSDIIEYSNGLYIFMNLDAMREMDGVDEDYYNVLISNKEVEVDNNMLLSCITRKGISDVGYLLLDSMMGMIITMIIMSVVLFCCVMYLLMKMIIDRSSFSISLLKIFGYSNKEVKKLYLNVSLYIVLLSIVIHIPLSQVIVGFIFPNTVSDVTAYIRAYLSPDMYAIIALLILGSYYAVYGLLYRKIKKISFVEVLKQRE